jgi:hypothetical protein
MQCETRANLNGETKTKLNWLSLLVVLRLILILGLAYYSWHLSSRLQEASHASIGSAPPFSSLPGPRSRDWNPRMGVWDPSGRFSQSMTFPAEIDEGGMRIDHDASVITISMPKKK